EFVWDPPANPVDTDPGDGGRGDDAAQSPAPLVSVESDGIAGAAGGSSALARQARPRCAGCGFTSSFVRHQPLSRLVSRFRKRPVHTRLRRGPPQTAPP